MKKVLALLSIGMIVVSMFSMFSTVRAQPTSLPRIGNWRPGDAHIHSYPYSSSDIPPPTRSIGDIAQDARNSGLEWIIITDHSYDMNAVLWQEAQMACEQAHIATGIAYASGEELSVDESEGDGPWGDTGHYLSYGLSSFIENKGGSPPGSWPDEPNAQDAINTVNGQGGVGFIAHPFNWAWDWNNWGVTGYTGIEVWNGGMNAENPDDEAMQLWDSLLVNGLASGRHVVGIGSSDAHPGGGTPSPYEHSVFTFLNLPSLTEDAIVDAYKGGHAIFSNGPLLTFKIGQKVIGDTAYVNRGSSVTLNIEWAVPDFAVMQTVRIRKICTSVSYSHDISISQTAGVESWTDSAPISGPCCYRLEGFGVRDNPWPTPDETFRVYTNPIWISPVGGETVVYSEGFESSNGGYTHTGTLDQWEWGSPTSGPGSAHSSSKCWATNLDGDIPKGSNSYLTSPAIALPSLEPNQVLRVRFYAWIAVDEMYDRGEFQVSSDGLNFAVLGELFHVMLGDWTCYDFDISAYAGGNIYLRFRCSADSQDAFSQSAYNMAGLYVDDVKITAFGAPPTKTVLTLEAYEDQYVFASCPWIFTWNGSEFVQDNDVYSTAVGAAREYTDYYRLNTPIFPKNNEYLMELREITDEASCTDLVRLLAVDHPSGVSVAPDENGNIQTYRSPISPITATDGKGSNILTQLSEMDEIGFSGYDADVLVLDFSNVDTSNGATFVLRAQGFRTDGDPGVPTGKRPCISIETMDESQSWASRHLLYPRDDWTTAAFDFTDDLSFSKLVRLSVTSCHTGKYHVIDYVGLDNSTQAPMTAHSLLANSAVHSVNGDVLTKTQYADNEYASMCPGEKILFSFPVPEFTDEAREFILVTKGYYLLGGTYFVYTWDGSSWAERDGWSVEGPGDQKHAFDLSLFLPDPDGEYKIRIWQDYWYRNAGIDCVELSRNELPGTLTSAYDIRKSLDVTSLLRSSDNTRDEWTTSDSGLPYGRLRNRWVEVKFAFAGPPNMPPTTSPIVVSSLTSLTPTISWTYADFDGDPQVAYEVEVWTGSKGSGVCLWDPPVGVGFTSSIAYAGAKLDWEKVYYARVRAFDGEVWGQWYETPFVLTSPALRNLLETQRDFLVDMLDKYANQLATVYAKAYLSLGETERAEFVNWFGNLSGQVTVNPEIKKTNDFLESCITSSEAREYYDFLQEMYSAVSQGDTLEQLKELFKTYILGKMPEQEHYLTYNGIKGISEVISNVTINYNDAIASLPEDLPPDFPLTEFSELLAKQNDAIKTASITVSDLKSIGTDVSPSMLTVSSLDQFEAALDCLSSEGTDVLTAYSIQSGMESSPLIVTTAALFFTVYTGAMIIYSAWMSYRAAATASQVVTAIGTVQPPPTPVQPPELEPRARITINDETAASIEATRQIEEAPKQAKRAADLAKKLTELAEDLKKEKDKDGEITNVETPSIAGKSLNGSQTGSITLTNTGTEAVTPYVYVNIVGPTIGGEHPRIVQAWPKTQVTLQPGETKTIDFMYSVPMPEVFGQCFIYLAQVRALFGAFQEDYYTSTFAACNEDAQGAIQQMTTNKIMEGEIAAGESLTTQVKTSEGTSQVEFVLTFPGSDIDLHVYDQLGNHVGLNYATGEVDLGITGSKYSGSEKPIESILIRGASNQEFEVMVVGVNTISKEQFTVTMIETPSISPLMHASPSRIELALRAGESRRVSLVVAEYGGQSDIDGVEFAVTNLADNFGQIIPNTCVTFNPDTFDLVAGGAMPVLATIELPMEQGSGRYNGIISATALSSLREEIEITVEVIDTTPPKTTLIIGEPQINCSGNTYVTSSTPFMLNAVDDLGGSGVATTAYRIYNATYDSGWIEYKETFNLTSLRDGTYTIEYNSTDNAKNTETTHAINVTRFSWNYIYQDTYGRGTTLKINLAYKFFQFTTPDKDYGIIKATYMQTYRTTITILHKDSQLKLITGAIDTKIDFCITCAWDMQTHKIYSLVDKPGIEK